MFATYIHGSRNSAPLVCDCGVAKCAVPTNSVLATVLTKLATDTLHGHVRSSLAHCALSAMQDAT